MKRYNIAFICTDLAYGGAETQLVRLATRLKAKGWDVRVVSLMPPRAYVDELEASGIPVFSLGIQRKLPDPRPILRFARFVREWRAHIVHSSTVHANLFPRLLLALLAVFMQHIRIVFPTVARSGVSAAVVYLKEHKESLFNINNYRLSNIEFGAMYYPVLLYLSKWHGFWIGKSYLNAFMWIFPRSFYNIMNATKPPRIVERLVEESALSGGFGFPISLEAWVNFGLIGVLVILFLVGIILSMVAKFQFSSSLGGIIFYAMILSFPFDLYRSSMATNATLLTNYFIVFITSLLCFACLTQKDPFREQIIESSDKELGNAAHNP